MKHENLDSTASRALVDLVKEACAAVSNSSSKEGERVFFPHGIELIRASVTVGTSSAPLASAELVIAGAAAPNVPKSLDLGQVLTAHALVAPRSADGVLQACKDSFAANKNACNRFVNAVIKICAPTAAFPDSYLADDIVNAIASAPWQALAAGDAATAVQMAASGNLVVAGLTGAELGDTHGHVVIIHGHARPSDGVPFGSWGKDSTTINPAIDQPISGCFRGTARPQIHYSYISI